MARKLRPATDQDLIKVATAIFHLKVARDLFKEVGAKQTVKRVRKALDSADGARRHVRRCEINATPI